MPLRCLVNGIKTVLWPIRRALYGPRQIFFQSQVMDFARLGLVLITCMAPWSPLVFSNTSGKLLITTDLVVSLGQFNLRVQCPA